MTEIWRKWKDGAWKTVFLPLFLCALLLVALFFAMNATIPVKITPHLSNGTVTFRGASIGGTWVNIYSVVVDYGNWEIDFQSGLAKATDGSPLILALPLSKQESNLVFNCSPYEGSCTVQIFNTTTELALKQSYISEFGCSYNISLYSSLFLTQRLFILSLAALFFAIAATFAILALQKRYDGQLVPHLKEIASSKYAVFLFFVLLGPGIIILLMYTSISTTPLAPKFYGYDMQAFITQGMFWAKGVVPYSQAFDHKGPLTFFIYMIGWLINSKYGIFILQCVFLWISMLFAYKIGAKLTDPLKGMLCALACLAFYTLVNDEGGLCEEFNLPFLMISTYYVICFLAGYERNRSDCRTHPPKYAFIHGMVIAVAFCFRATNAVAICGFVFSIVIFLIVKKSLFNLFLNALSFLGGFSAVLVPFLIYFMWHGAVDDLFWGMIQYNFMYAVDTVVHSKKELVIIALYLLPALACAFLSFWRKPLFRNTMVLSVIVTAIVLIRLALFPHYYIILLPFVPIAIGLLLQNDTKCSCHACWCRSQIISRCAIAMTLLYVIFSIHKNVIENSNRVSVLKVDKSGYEYSQAVREQAALIPQEEREAVIAYNTDAKWYIETEIIPCFKYYFYQEWQSSKSDKMREENEKFYESLSAKWIVVGRYGVQNEKIQAVLDTYYELCSTIHIEQENYDISLYHLK